MNIGVKLAFDEAEALRLLNWLARCDARIMKGRPDLPMLYDSGVRYQTEEEETWSDYINLLAQGHEDCDALAAARAGELKAYGYRALNLRRGDHGAKEARRRRLKTIQARVILRTRTDTGKPGMYHCLVRYKVGRKWYYDDPSIRLGMHGGIIDLRQPKVTKIPKKYRLTVR